MKSRLALVLALLLLASAAWATTPPTTATVFSNIDDQVGRDNGSGSVGWGWCTTCAGGATSATTFWMLQNQTTPSLDGTSTEFYTDGSAYSNVLFWYNVGAHDTASNFQTDFWVQIDQNSTVIGQAFEFDTYQFVNGRQFMFGTQCDYSKGYVWDVWSQAKTQWIPTTIPCDLVKKQALTPNVWYHITWNFHRAGKLEYYDSITVVRYDSAMNVVSNVTYSASISQGSAKLPAGWINNLGVQFQMDLNGNAGVGSNPTTMTEHIDNVTLTAW